VVVASLAVVGEAGVTAYTPVGVGVAGGEVTTPTVRPLASSLDALPVDADEDGRLLRFAVVADRAVRPGAVEGFTAVTAGEFGPKGPADSVAGAVGGSLLPTFPAVKPVPRRDRDKELGAAVVLTSFGD
jgi:hypothetical protein